MREYYKRRVKANFAPNKRTQETLDDSLDAESPSTGSQEDSMQQKKLKKRNHIEQRKPKIENLAP